MVPSQETFNRFKAVLIDSMYLVQRFLLSCKTLNNNIHFTVETKLNLSIKVICVSLRGIPIVLPDIREMYKMAYQYNNLCYCVVPNQIIGIMLM